jgi:hypothetical protein
MVVVCSLARSRIGGEMAMLSSRGNGTQSCGWTSGVVVVETVAGPPVSGALKAVPGLIGKACGFPLIIPDRRCSDVRQLP